MRFMDNSPDFVTPSLLKTGLGGVRVYFWSNWNKRSIFLIFILCFRLSYAAEPSTPDQKSSLVKSEDVIGKKISDYKLIDQDGKEFTTSAFMGKPFVVSFIYTSCTYICGTITQSLSNVVKEKMERFGKDFNLLTVSFDPERDTPRRLREFGVGFTKDFTHWRFATANKETIDRMTKDFGFFYKKEENHFQHMNMVSVVGANGNILTHVYGVDFKPEQVLNPIYYPELSRKVKKEGFTGLVEKVVLFCYKYDPSTNRYRLDYPLLARMLLEGTLLFSILFFVWRKEIGSFFSRLRRTRPSNGS